MDMQEIGRQRKIWKGIKRKEAREGVLESQEGALVRRPAGEITDIDEINGDMLEPILFMTSIENKNAQMAGGVVVLAKLDLASQMAVMGIAGTPSHRPSTADEVAAYRRQQTDKLNERIASARTLSIREDAKFGKRN